jgi:hypothetical protein
LVIGAGATVYAGNLNIEGAELVPRVQNLGGTLAVFGAKTESHRQVTLTSNGGQTEILGGFYYPVSPQTNPEQSILHIVDNAFGFFSYQEEVNSGILRAFQTHLRHTIGTTTAEVKREQLPTRYGDAKFAPALVAHLRATTIGLSRGFLANFTAGTGRGPAPFANASARAILLAQPDQEAYLDAVAAQLLADKVQLLDDDAVIAVMTSIAGTFTPPTDTD